MDLVAAVLAAVLSGSSLSSSYYYVSAAVVMTIAAVPAPADFRHNDKNTRKAACVFFIVDYRLFFILGFLGSALLIPLRQNGRLF